MAYEGVCIVVHATLFQIFLCERAETISAAAIKVKDGRIFQGRSHSDAWDAALDAGGFPGYDGTSAVPNHHWDAGFVTSSGRFVDRLEAFQIARAARQLKHKTQGIALDAYDARMEGKKQNGIEKGVAKPDDLKEIMREVSLGRDSKGYFVYTHRCRSGSYKTPHAIPKSKIEFVGSTG